ncbi:MAG: 50S ribosomal protein L9 [Actinobacteria bacterium]|nr:50S ribosomal protein L9 [Actinomycetota bacterium]
MQAILTKDVEGLGTAGAVVSVARGYMRNYLLPRQLAEVATAARIAEIERREGARQAAAARAAAEADGLRDLLSRTILTLKAKAGADGRLFGSITSGDVSDAIMAARGVRIDRRHITVDPPIRSTGTYSVPVEVGPGLVAEVKTLVSPLHED